MVFVLPSIFRFFAFVLFLAFFVLASPQIASATAIFQDDFNDGNSDGWIVPNNRQWDNSSLPCMNGSIPAEWEVKDGMYGIVISSPGCVTETTPDDNNWNDAWNDYIFELDMKFVRGTDKNIAWRYTGHGEWIDLHFIGSSVIFQRAILINSSNIQPLNDGSTYHFRIEVVGNNFKVFFNNILIPSNVSFMEGVDSTNSFPTGRPALQASVGADPNSEVWFDNIVVTSIGPDTIGPFELPFAYGGRLTENPDAFSNAFQNRAIALFDHQPNKGVHTPFTGEIFNTGDCGKTGNPVSCYDSHTATDFSALGGTDVFPVMDGGVVYSSQKIPGSDKCIPKEKGFGCVLIIKHQTDEFGILYTQYAHLDTISDLGEGLNNIDVSDKLGTMGKTGRATGIHLDLSAFKESPSPFFLLNSRKSRSFWEDFLNFQPSNKSLGNKKSFCSYNSPLGTRLEFIDPSGWASEDPDPWSLARDAGGCEIQNEYLWKFNILEF